MHRVCLAITKAPGEGRRYVKKCPAVAGHFYVCVVFALFGQNAARARNSCYLATSDEHGCPVPLL